MFSSDRGQGVALHSGRRLDDEDRQGFRPVALPALAAAVQVAASAAQAARATLAAKARTFRHEDDPQD